MEKRTNDNVKENAANTLNIATILLAIAMFLCEDFSDLKWFEDS